MELWKHGQISTIQKVPNYQTVKVFKKRFYFFCINHSMLHLNNHIFKHLPFLFVCECSISMYEFACCGQFV